MVQSKQELDEWYARPDPWQYESNPDDRKRREILLSELPRREYARTLDIGCGDGFITQVLPGVEVIGTDISDEAVRKAASKASSWKGLSEKRSLGWVQSSLYDLPTRVQPPFDLIVITGVLYPQYIGESKSLVYRIVDDLLARNGVLVSVHIQEWYTARFPYLRIKESYYSYREYTHLLEMYVK